MNQPSPIKRRVSRQIQVGDVPIGGDAPIAVQSMTTPKPVTLRQRSRRSMPLPLREPIW